MNLSYSGLSNKGQVRAENQDSILLPQNGCSPPCLFLLADGMDGANGGKTASDLAIRIASRIFTQNELKIAPEQALRLAVQTANKAIYERAREEPLLHGMGTTLVGLAILQDGKALVVNVGDSRCYLLRDGELHQISEDHSVMQEMVRNGKMTEGQAREHGLRNMLSRAVGTSQNISADLFAVTTLAVNDFFLLCSDGLHGPVPDDQIHAIMIQHQDISIKTQQLVQRANDNGGPDNISVILARINQEEYQPGVDEITLHKKVTDTTTIVVAPTRLGFFRRFLGK